MKIFELPVPVELQPATQGMNWPPDCRNYGVEQDFHQWLHGPGANYLTDDLDEVDWWYAPIYWNRWFWQNPEERHPPAAIRDYIADSVFELERTFTIAEFGPIGEFPELDLNGMTIFAASRRGNTGEIDIPLLLHEHRLHPVAQKKWLASYAGTYVNDAMRWYTYEALKDRHDVFFSEGNLSISEFVLLMQESYIALAPRGVGISSFRFYEAMQAGTVPLLISDVDGRPFKEWIDWDSCSLYRESADGLSDFLDSIPLQELVEKGKNAQRIWYDKISYGKWCKYPVRELEQRLPA